MPVFEESLRERRTLHAYRALDAGGQGLVDFSSNDYLGLAKHGGFRAKVRFLIEAHAGDSRLFGAGASRLVSGDSEFLRSFEQSLAAHLGSERALIFSSGYLANLGLIAFLAETAGALIYDQFCHSSVKEGLSKASGAVFPFRHNDLEHLEKRLEACQGLPNVFVLAESLYSMDGDFAALPAMARLARRYGARLVLDEAHAFGWYGEGGRGLSAELEAADLPFARVITFGKALGGMGAAVVGSEELIESLINFCRAFIYSTGPSILSLLPAQAAFQMLQNGDLESERARLHSNIAYFRARQLHAKLPELLPSDSPIQAWIAPGNLEALAAAEGLRERGFHAKAIRSPTVPRGKERVRLSIHADHSWQEIEALFDALSEISSPHPSHTDGSGMQKTVH